MFNNFSKSVFYKVAFPLAVYFVLFNLLFSVGKYANESLFNNSVPGLYFTAIAAAITFVVMLFMYKNANVYKVEPMFEASKLPKEILLILSIVVLGVVLNYVASHFPLVEVSESFKDANAYLNNGDMVSKILANVIVTPALEELVFRGIVCGELEKKFDIAPTVILSAFIFGILHFNWVQMIYAFIVGLLIGYVYEETHKLWVVYAGHVLLNLVVVMSVYFLN